MKQLVYTFIFVTTITYVNAQPCKMVKPGMSKWEVSSLVGQPTEIDTIPDSSMVDLMVVWQYGEPKSDTNQRVTFTGDKVSEEVIVNGKKFDEIAFEFMKGGCTEKEFGECARKLFLDGCK